MKLANVRRCKGAKTHERPFSAKPALQRLEVAREGGLQVMSGHPALITI